MKLARVLSFKTFTVETREIVKEMVTLWVKKLESALSLDCL